MTDQPKRSRWKSSTLVATALVPGVVVYLWAAHHFHKERRDFEARIRPGMSKNEVRRTVGEPDKSWFRQRHLKGGETNPRAPLRWKLGCTSLCRCSGSFCNFEAST